MQLKHLLWLATAALCTALLATPTTALLYYNRGPAIDYSGFFGPQGQRPVGIYTSTGFPMSNSWGSYGWSRPGGSYGFFGSYYLYNDGARVSSFDRYRASRAARYDLPVRYGNTLYEPGGWGHGGYGGGYGGYGGGYSGYGSGYGGYPPPSGCSYWC